MGWQEALLWYAGIVLVACIITILDWPPRRRNRKLSPRQASQRRREAALRNRAMREMTSAPRTK